MEKKKKIWTEPKLTALVRRKPEEGILGVCKVILSYGPLENYDGCKAVLEDYCRVPPCKDLGST